ncbi:MAG: helix-turn-helix domain-containing protein [Anaerolineales bacterium]|nr:helix-turn-helix domain-containing protein [Anaerolineales bacterium]
MAEDWLSLSEAAGKLGVHPSTVRSWSDQGHLPAHRTQGGHRRFRRSDVDLWIQTHREDGLDEGHLVVQAALKNIRVKVSEGTLESEGWYEKLDDEARGQYRLSGRALLQGLLDSLAMNGEYDNSEARSLGFEYASRGWRRGLTAAEASRAFLFFRNTLFDAMLTVYEESAIQTPKAWSDIFRKIYRFTDQIQITLLETYEAYQRGNR